jgi:hypothetical protein
MSLSTRTAKALAFAVADNVAAAELATAINAGAGGVGQAVGTSATPTFASLTLSTGDLSVPTGKGVKVNGHRVISDQQPAVVPVAITYTSGSHAAATGALTIAAEATPTVQELLTFCVELLANVTSLQAVLHAHGLTT